MKERLPLFLYGTLLSGTGVAAIDRLVRRGLRPLGPACVPGRLYDLGACPAAVPAVASRACIKGQLFALRPDPALLARLDRYEDDGVLFARTVVTAYTVPDGRARRCWIYRGIRSVRGRPVIAFGDYLAHLRRRRGRSRDI